MSIVPCKAKASFTGFGTVVVEMRVLGRFLGTGRREALCIHRSDKNDKHRLENERNNGKIQLFKKMDEMFERAPQLSAHSTRTHLGKFIFSSGVMGLAVRSRWTSCACGQGERTAPMSSTEMSSVAACIGAGGPAVKSA